MALSSSRYHMPRKAEVEPVSHFFNPLILSPSSNSESQKSSSKASNRISASLNSIMYTVHKQLREQAPLQTPTPRPTTVPAIPAVIAETMPKGALKKMPTLSKLNAPHMSQDLAGVNRNTGRKLRDRPLTRSIPQTKANYEMKSQQRMRRAIGVAHDMNNFTNQKRVQEILRQKCILQDILLEHKKLQRDRQSIAVEIQSMRNYLNEIRGRLDFSLRKLSTKKTVYENYKKSSNSSSLNSTTNAARRGTKRASSARLNTTRPKLKTKQ